MASVRLIVQDNLWFRGAPAFNNYRLFGKSMIPVDPLLGLTDSFDAEVKRQELQWLLRYTSRNGSGLVISQEWIRPDNSIDRNLRSTFLPVFEEHGGRAKWNLFYDPVLAATQRGLADSTPIDFSRPEIRQMWESDLDYFWDNYLRHPRYWRIGGRPVLYVWAVHSAVVGADEAFGEAAEEGIYILGDVLTNRVRDPAFLDSLPPLDGVTGFLVVTPELNGEERLLGDVVPEFEILYRDWAEAAAARGKDFIPAGSCQYDDTEYQTLRGGRPTRILARSAAEVESYLRLAAGAAPPVRGTRYVFWGTANNWAEGTTLLPTEPPPPGTDAYYVFRCVHGVCARRIGNYGFDHLEAVRRTVFPETTPYEGPVIRATRPRRVGSEGDREEYAFRVDLKDCDRLGSLRVRARRGVEVLNPPDFSTLENLRSRPRFRYRWRARVRVDRSAPPSSLFLRIRFRNVDGRRASLTVFDGAIPPAELRIDTLEFAGRHAGRRRVRLARGGGVVRLTVRGAHLPPDPSRIRLRGVAAEPAMMPGSRSDKLRLKLPLAGVEPGRYRVALEIDGVPTPGLKLEIKDG